MEGDPELLRSSFENVIRNAVRYSPAATHVGITARRLAGGGDYEEAVEIIIYDQGPGVPEKDLELIFEAFYRVDAARAAPWAGRDWDWRSRPARCRCTAAPSRLATCKRAGWW